LRQRSKLISPPRVMTMSLPREIMRELKRKRAKQSFGWRERVAMLQAEGMEPVRKQDLPLVRAAGGAVTALKNATPGKRYWVSSIIHGAVEVCRQVGYRSKQSPLRILRELNQAKMIGPVGKLYHTAEIDPVEINRNIAKILGLPVVMGPLRAFPDGSFEIAMGEGRWEKATDELVRSLDAEARLGGKKSMAHFAAEVLLGWAKDGSGESP
jgi:hypothetical protein